MSLTVVNSKKVYADINDLPENIGINDGDRFIVQTDDGTALVDYENIRIDLDHTTFGSVVSELQEFQSLATNFITEISTQFTTAQGDISVLQTSVGTIEQQVAAVRYILKLILGVHSGDSEEAIELDKGDLSQEGQDFMTEVYGSVQDLDAEFSLSTNNLRNIATATTSVQDIKDSIEEIKAVNNSQEDAIANINANLGKIVADFLVPTGTVVPYAGMAAPSGWVMCDGQVINQAQYPALYDILRQAPGLVTETGEVCVPDLRGRFVKGRSGDGAIGAKEESALPNIKGGFNAGELYDVQVGAKPEDESWGVATSGPFYPGTEEDTVGKKNDAAETSSLKQYGFMFDASRANPAYMDGAEVTPPNISLNYIIKA